MSVRNPFKRDSRVSNSDSESINVEINSSLSIGPSLTSNYPRKEKDVSSSIFPPLPSSVASPDFLNTRIQMNNGVQPYCFPNFASSPRLPSAIMPDNVIDEQQDDNGLFDSAYRGKAMNDMSSLNIDHLTLSGGKDNGKSTFNRVYSETETVEINHSSENAVPQEIPPYIPSETKESSTGLMTVSDDEAVTNLLDSLRKTQTLSVSTSRNREHHPDPAETVCCLLL